MSREFDLAKYEAALIIDNNDLDEEVSRQAETYYHVYRAWTRAVSRRDEAYQAIKTMDAELSQVIREDKDEAGEKVTEAMLANLVLQHKSHKKAMAQYLSLKAEADTLEALKDSFAQRSYALRDAVQLYLSRVYSDPSVRGERSFAEIKVKRDRIASRRQRLREEANNQSE